MNTFFQMYLMCAVLCLVVHILFSQHTTFAVHTLKTKTVCNPIVINDYDTVIKI